MERWPEKSAGVLRPFCGRIALIFLDFWLLFCQEKSKKEKTVDQNKLATANIDPNQFAEAMGLRIYAELNPATTWVAFDYELPVDNNQAMIIIKNTEGKQIATFKINNGYGQKVWDTRSLKSGTYIYEFVSGELKQTGKIVIIN